MHTIIFIKIFMYIFFVVGNCHTPRQPATYLYVRRKHITYIINNIHKCHINFTNNSLDISNKVVQQQSRPTWLGVRHQPCLFKCTVLLENKHTKQNKHKWHFKLNMNSSACLYSHPCYGTSSFLPGTHIKVERVRDRTFSQCGI